MLQALEGGREGERVRLRDTDIREAYSLVITETDGLEHCRVIWNCLCGVDHNMVTSVIS